MPSFDRDVQILQDAHFAGRAHLSAITGDRDELDAEWNLDGAHQIAEKDERALEHADQEWIEAGIIACDLSAKLLCARLNSLGRDQLFKVGIAELRHDACFRCCQDCFLSVKSLVHLTAARPEWNKGNYSLTTHH